MISKPRPARPPTAPPARPCPESAIVSRAWPSASSTSTVIRARWSGRPGGVGQDVGENPDDVAGCVSRPVTGLRHDIDHSGVARPLALATASAAIWSRRTHGRHCGGSRMSSQIAAICPAPAAAMAASRSRSSSPDSASAARTSHLIVAAGSTRVMTQLAQRRTSRDRGNIP